MKTIFKALLVLITAITLQGPALAAPHAFPVPFVASKHQFIWFRDLPGEGTIRIVTVNGEEVIKLTIAPGEAIRRWDVMAGGKSVGAGVYYFEVDAAGQRSTGKIVIVR